MAIKVDLNKQVFETNQYKKVINTDFNQLVTPLSDLEPEEPPSTEEFFQLYNTLFFDIPKTGDESHEALIKQSSEYINYEPFSDELTALTEEITSLREQLLEARQQLSDLSDIEQTIEDTLDGGTS